jgi:hypothetical protein
LYAYKAQITQELKPDNKPKQLDFTTDILHWINMDPGFLPSILISDEAMFHQSGKVSGHIICIWELENPHIQRMVV